MWGRPADKSAGYVSKARLRGLLTVEPMAEYTREAIFLWGVVEASMVQEGGTCRFWMMDGGTGDG